MVKILMKMILLPVYLLLAFVSVIYDIGLRVYSFGAGLFYLFLFICLVLAAICQQGHNLLILVMILGGAVLLTVVIGIAGAFIETGKEHVRIMLTK